MKSKDDIELASSIASQCEEIAVIPGSAQITPIIIYGKRHIKKEKLVEFNSAYQVFSKSTYKENPDIKAIFAFPDIEDPFAYRHIVWGRNADALNDYLSRPTNGDPLWDMYDCSPERPDILTVYGGWDEEIKTKAQAVSGIHYEFKKCIAGFIKPDGGKEEGPPLFGFTMRYVKPGRIQDLGTSFQTVCDMWYEKIPGILMAAVFPDENIPNLVHDLRIFANHSAFLAHVDKSDKDLTEAMGVWFENYDTSVPFSGQLYAANTKDDALHTSSIKSRSTPRAQLETFHFGESGMLGQMPNMTRNDS
ncbi:hypothetical protein [Vibrio campbellii]|uniref:Uncharacterized protein n=1 Tax=Vibrio campbellii (strain ATCC BAA-1116) TaxID=2902295 RepID=A7N616_VIBC1|nr:hypothetical protein [Vibrio campbellii]ABU74833.1 hypothetical protein VIBHAR_06959 [Vibrio campbellii ATCC BAA-1116]AGU98169.1 hypothetical protein M892_17880 [Vibrio campbellii ATCC BAA-1116]MBT0123878.1 hypothetical protein [Vibrio campbellii]MBT0138847.1 hypothetical protein [Vibrio campbellii]MBT0143525.1 hypothetical protein [Vibrio campbellii]